VWGWLKWHRTAGPSPVPPSGNGARGLPAFVVAVDVETTGLGSNDRIVSLGAVWLSTACLSERCLPVSYLHLIFDPGKKSHPKAEQAHGFNDWLLRHQEPFEHYADAVSEFLNAGDVLIAHNAEFDIGFINRELVACGKRRVASPVCCTMHTYRASGHSGRASLDAVCSRVGLARNGLAHGALEDAWLALMAYLWLHGYGSCKPFSEIGAHPELFNVCPAPAAPSGELPRRKRRRRHGGV
jgi:DNA polymerase-3 subunit epsilon